MKGENLEEKPRILTGCDACSSYEFFRYGDAHLGDFRSVSAKDHRDSPYESQCTITVIVASELERQRSIHCVNLRHLQNLTGTFLIHR